MTATRPHTCTPLWLGPNRRPVCTQTDHYWAPAVAPAPKAGAR